MIKAEIYSSVYEALICNQVEIKLEQTQTLYQLWGNSHFEIIPEAIKVIPLPAPGRPEKPELVEAHAVDRRKLSTHEGRSAFLHALAHIEFNAINLALDAAYRFREMPTDFIGDWLKIAAEEATHFILIRKRLNTLGHDYGDFSAHNGLWEMAVQTAHDPLARMALVPRVLEARGLDVLPGIMHKFRSSGDSETVTILQRIHDDEIGHVATGNYWYNWLCGQRALAPLSTFRQLLQEYGAHRFSGPFHAETRRAAGFTEEELKMLEDSFRTERQA